MSVTLVFIWLPANTVKIDWLVVMLYLRPENVNPTKLLDISS
jgi:hypothetical protein